MASMNKIKIGQVLSNKMNKTIIVQVESYRHHPIYKKTMRNIVNYKVHDEKNECAVGDTVKIAETRPISKEKRWRVSEILIRAAAIEVKPEEIEPKFEKEAPKAQPEMQAEPSSQSVDTKPAEVKQD